MLIELRAIILHFDETKKILNYKSIGGNEQGKIYSQNEIYW